MKSIIPFAAALLLLLSSVQVKAQWSELGGANSSTLTSVPRDIVKDAAGNLYAGGGCFVNANGKYFLAKWNGTTWAEVGGANTSTFSGGLGGIYRIAFDAAGNIYVCGSFLNANGKAYIAKWDGTTWTELGGTNSSTWIADGVNALKVAKDGTVYAAGFFKNTGSKRYVAQWDGTIWSELGGVNSLTVNNDIQHINIDGAGNVYLTGLFTTAGKSYIAKWDGTAWTKYATTPNASSSIHNIVFDAAGNIYANGGWSNTTPTGGYVAKWDGTTWAELGGANTTPFDISTSANLVKDSFGNLYIAGDCLNASGYTYVAKWDGTAWTELGGVNGTTFGPPFAADLSRLFCDSLGKLYVVGAGAKNANGKYYVAVYGSVCTPTTSSQNLSICSSALPYTWNGLTFTAAGSQTKTGLTNAAGCDSSATLNLTVTTCVTGAALSFDGVDDYVSLPNNAINTQLSTGQITGSAWINMQSKAQWGTIIKNWGDTAGAFHFGLNDISGKISIQFTQANGNIVSVVSPNSLSTNAWHNVAFSANGTILSLYENGVLVGSTTYDGTIKTNFPATFIGAKPNDAGNGIAIINSGYWDGKIDEVRIWNRGLTACEIAASMNCEMSSPHSNLIAYYKFNQGIAPANNTAITSLTDVSGNGYDGTLTNFALTGTTSNFIAVGGVVSGVSCGALPIPTFSNTNFSICPSALPYTWNGLTFIAGGTQVAYLTNSVNCDSTATLNLTINQPTASTTTQSACVSYLWNGVTYTTSGIKTKTFVGGNSNGCDSTATLNLTINQPTASTTSQAACVSYTWNGVTYTTSGIKTKTFIGGNSIGCDSTATLNLTINQPTSSTTTQSACVSYLWNGITYTTSGAYNKLFVGGNAQGCDSTANLNLTINLPTSSTTTQSACVSYLWNGITYTTSGAYNKLFVGGNSKGCDSTANLNLTIKSNTTSTNNISICPAQLPYTWNGLTFTAAGTQTKTGLVNSQNCDSSATLILTIQTLTLSINTPTITQPSCGAFNGKIVVNVNDTVVINGSLDVTDSVQTGRLLRGGPASACGTPAINPGLGSPIGLRYFDSYTFTNTTAVIACVTTTITTANFANIYLGTYLGYYDKNNPLTNYLGAPGFQPTTSTFSSTQSIAPGQTIVVVVHNMNEVPDAAGAYTLTITGLSPAKQYSIDNGANWLSVNTFPNLGTSPFYIKARVEGSCLQANYANNPVYITIPNASSSTTNSSICPSLLPYTWNGLTFTTGGTQVAHLFNSVNCDSAATLNLIIKNIPTSTTTITATNYYIWNAVRYIASGTYTKTFVGGSSNGCDSVANLILTLNMTAPFITKWKTDNLNTGSSNSTSVNIPTFGSGYNYDVDWNNDGIYDDFGLTGNAIHDYGTVGTYTIAIRGSFPSINFGFNNTGDQTKLVSIDQWGDIAWASMAYAFDWCVNVVGNATDVPNLSNVTDMNSMFAHSSFNQNIGNWDVSHVINMSYLFSDAHIFNQNIGSWNVGNVTDMRNMFYNAHAFNQNISSWNVSKVTDMSYMFYSGFTFNQPIGVWNVGKVTTMSNMFVNATAFNQPLANWQVGAVTNMTNMFYYAQAFNQNIAAWDVSKVIKMDYIFYNATVFNQNISSWNVGAATNMSDMFFNTAISATNYDAILISWNNAGYLNKNIGNAAPLKYCAGLAARASLITKGWTITGDTYLGTTSTTNTKICPSALPFIWNGLTFTVGGTKTAHITNSEGCDSAATLNLIINTNTTSTQTVSICSTALPYIWNGIRTTAGTYTFLTTNAQGCDSTATLVLIVNQPTTSSTTKTACTNYLWNGTTYTTSGTKTYVTTNSNGCDSTATLVLTITNTPIEAALIVASQLFKNENVSIVNISQYKTDSAKWILPSSPAMSIVSSSNNLLELKFTDTGSYTIGLHTYIGLCDKITMKTVQVIEGSSLPDPGAIRDPFIKVFTAAPNPNFGVFTTKVKLSSISNIRLRLINAFTNKIVNDRTEVGSKDYTLSYNLSLTAGLYVLILETPKGNLISKIIVP